MGISIALLDDCSRFVVAAYYFPDEKGTNILQLLKEAFTASGRPNQILADNGAGFHALMAQVETKYTHLLKTLGVEPIFARPHHPQTKGKFGAMVWCGHSNVFSGRTNKDQGKSCNDDRTMSIKTSRSGFIIITTKNPIDLFMANPPLRYTSKPNPACIVLETLVNWDLWINTTALAGK